MRTIAITATVSEDGELRARLPVPLPPGEHHLVLMLVDDAQPSPDDHSLVSSDHNVAPLQLETFPFTDEVNYLTWRREDIYEDVDR